MPPDVEPANKRPNRIPLAVDDERTAIARPREGLRWRAGHAGVNDYLVVEAGNARAAHVDIEMIDADGAHDADRVPAWCVRSCRPSFLELPAPACRG